MLDFTGAGNRNRTHDLLITNQLLYQLSYAGKAADYNASTDKKRSARRHLLTEVYIFTVFAY